MKRLALIIFALLACSAFGQNVRVGPIPFPSVSAEAPPFIVANLPPNSPTLAVCHSPANAVPCTNFVTTFTGQGVACPNGAQDTPDPNSTTSACQPTGDAQGNLGFWVPPGIYDYTVCIQNNCFGPYTVTLSATSGPQYNKLRCESGLGDGLNALPSGTYLQAFCYNDSGVTWTIKGIKCFTDNSGTSTVNASGHTLGALLGGPITCTSAFAAGTQSANILLTSGDWINFTFVADGTSKQTTWVVSFTQ